MSGCWVWDCEMSCNRMVLLRVFGTLISCFYTFFRVKRIQRAVSGSFSCLHACNKGLVKGE